MKYAMIATWKMSFDGVKKGCDLLKNHKESSEALLCAIHDVERNPHFHSVGLSGLPNEEGVVQCDAGFMDGKTLQFGAVGALENVVHAIDIAQLCSQNRFNNVLVGEGACQFAKQNGYLNENLITKESVQLYQKRLHKTKELKSYDGHDTVGVIALDGNQHMCCGTSTSGLFMKKKGRLGDSPLIGSGFYCDDEIGGACATGVGEEIMRGCLSYEVVRKMKEGLDPMLACQSTVDDWNQRMIRKKGYCDAVSIICMNRLGEIGIGTNVKFAFVYGNESNQPKVMVAIPKHNQLILREYDDIHDELD